MGARAVRALPAGPRYAIAGAGGSAWFALSPGQRRNALVNYGAVLGLPPADPRVRRTARAAFANYGRVLADFVLIASLSGDEVRRRVEVDRLDVIDDCLTRGKGLVLAAPHMGSWDVAGSFAGAAGYRVAAVTDRFPGSLDTAVVETRRALGMRVIPAGRSAVRVISDELAANAILCLLCDIPHGPGLDVEFFGRRAHLPNGPAAFAQRTGAPLVPACVILGERPGHYRVLVTDPIEVWKDGGRAEQARAMQEVVCRFEEFIRPRPDQWFAFRSLFS